MKKIIAIFILVTMLVLPIFAEEQKMELPKYSKLDRAAVTCVVVFVAVNTGFILGNFYMREYK